MKQAILILFGFLLLGACNSGSGGSNEPLPLDENGRESFAAFHKLFYTDSVFQMKRVEFPMLGNNPNGSEEPFYWDIDNWTFKKAPKPNDPDITTVPFFDMDDVMRERIIVQNRFMIENLFSLIDNKWYLTQYSGIKDIGSIVNKKNNSATSSDSTATDDAPVSVTN